MLKLKDLFTYQITGEWGTDCLGNSNDVNIIRTTNFTKIGVIDYKEVVKRNIAPNKIEDKRLKFGDIILEKSGGTDKTPVGRIVFCDSKIESDIFLCNNFTQAMRPNTDIVVPKFIFYYMWYMHYIGKTDLMQNKTTGIRNLQVNFYLNQEIDLPIINEQNKIVNILDRLQYVISKKNEQLSKLDELVKARFVEMFGDPVSNTMKLPEMTLNEIGYLGRGVSKHRPRNASELLGGSYPLIQTGEVAKSELYITNYENTYSKLGLQQSKMWEKGTLCITIAANIAKTAILTFDACFPDSVVGFKANKYTNNVFVHFWFLFFQSILESQAPESAQKNINLKILSELKVIVPPIELQNEFAKFVEQVEKSKKDIQQSLEKLETLKKSLMQEYFG